MCIQEADAFYRIAKNISKTDPDFPLSISVYPVIVNLAFCCELYFKALMIFRSPNNEFNTGHSLKTLFRMLNEHDKNGIKSKCGCMLKTSTFTEAITEFDNAFIDWRYSFESKSNSHIKIYELFSFTDAIHSYCTDVIKID